MNACTTINVVAVAVMTLRNGSVDRFAIRSPTIRTAAKRATTISAPTRPNSSPITAKMKSLCACGR